MSYDFAVWDGDQPADDQEALSVFQQLFDEYLGGDELTPPTPLIASFAASMSERWPDTLSDEPTPWSAGSPEYSSSGPIAYLAMTWSQGEEVSDYAVETATRLGLICFDPQRRSLRS